MTIRRILAALGVVGVGAVLLVAVQMSTQADVQPVEKVLPSELLPVRMEAVRLVDEYVQKRKYTGTVEPRRRSQLSFEVSGKVTRVLADEGAEIYEGEVLAELDTRRLKNQKQQRQAQLAQAQSVLDELLNGSRVEDIEAAKARVAEVQAELDFQVSQLKRREDLFRRGVISDTEYDDVVRSSEAARRRLESTRKEYEKLVAGPRKEQIEAQRATVDQLKEQIAMIDIDLADATLKSPFSGSIVTRLVDEGVVVQAGQQVFELVESTHLEARVGIPVEKCGLLQLGREYPAEIHRKTFSLKLKSLLAQVDQSTRTRLAIFELPAEVASEVIAEEVVRLELEETVHARGFWIPISGTQQAGKGLWSCYVLTPASPEERARLGVGAEAGEVYRTKLALVEILATDETRVFVRGTLSDGDLVVKEGAHRIAEGQFVVASQSVSVGN